jgi:hypothetical protein
MPLKYSMPYQGPIAKVTSTQQQGDVATVAIKISRQLHVPIAPAGLYDQSNPDREVFQLHKLIEESTGHLVFETYSSESVLPRVGGKFIFRSWWTADAIEAVQDTDVKWVRKRYPDNRNHDHCLLTWATISSYSENIEGYYLKYGWITVQAYNKYIKQDCFHLRKTKARH